VGGLRTLTWFTLAATLALVSLAVWTDTLNYDPTLPRRFAEYLVWAFLQQVGLQTFLTRRMQQVFRHPAAVAFASSVLFALIHLPNPLLMGFTLVGGMFWCLSFQKAPNLYALALSHAWLAVTALVCVPPAWMHQLRIGPDY
jgi:membrane protease YdiL (CAAX protease family)